MYFGLTNDQNEIGHMQVNLLRE